MLRAHAASFVACVLLGCGSTTAAVDPGPAPTRAPEPGAREQDAATPPNDAIPPASDPPAHDKAPANADEVTVIRAEERSHPPSGEIPRVRVATPTVGPSYSADVLRRVMRSKSPALRACYVTLLAERPEARGHGQLRFTISPDGTVAAASMDLTAFEGDAFVTCVLGIIRDARFPAPTGGGSLVVTYPLVFIPSGEPTTEDLAGPRG